MAGEWQVSRLGDHIALKGGLSYKGEFVDKGSALLIGMGCVSYIERFLPQGARRYGGDYTSAHLVEPGDLVIATRQQSDNLPILGFPAMIPDKFKGRDVIVGTNLYKVANRSRISNRFLYWLLRGNEYRARILGCAKGTTVRMLTKDAIEDFRFLCPPADERNAITAVLDALDDKIELNRKMNETLEAIARGLFKSWFLDFDPVRAKAEGRDPGLPAHIADLFPDCFENSELGEIPASWATANLGDIADNPRRTIKPAEIEEETPYIALEHMPRECIALSEWGSADGIGSSKFAFAKHEILFGKLRPYFHKVGVAPVDGICSTDILVIQPRTPNWFGLVLGHASSREFVRYSNAGSTGTKMPRTSWTDMRKYPVVLPPEPLARAFTDLICPMIDRIIGSVHEAKTLAATRNCLLPKLISGELRVTTAEQLLGAAV